VFVTTGNPGFDTVLTEPEYTNSVVALDGQTGGILWALQTSPPPQDRDTDYRGAPVLVNASCGQLAVAGSADGYVYAHDSSTGQVRWVFPEVESIPYPGPHNRVIGGIYPAATLGNLVFTAARSSANVHVADTLYALNACAPDPFRRFWSIKLDAALLIGPPSVANGVLYVGTANDPSAGLPGLGTLYAIDIFDLGLDGTPKVLFTSWFLGRIASEPTITDGMVYVSSHEGVVRAYHSP
jgi:outer membrane protein assembly factor BamB